MNKFLGTVKFFKEEGGFGFITPDEPIPDVTGDIFFHRTKVNNNAVLSADDKVEFSVGEGRKGLEAINITRFIEPNATDPLPVSG